jgi:hypothetical protein
MRFFDCNASYGKTATPPLRYASSADELVEEMRFCGVEKALVYHSSMRFGCPNEWNSVIVGQTIKRNLIPTWTILPHQTGEQLPPKEFVAELEASGIRALRAFPGEHHYRLDRRTFGELFDILSDRKIPLFVKQDIVSIGELLREFPSLTVVALNQGPHSIERYLRPIMDEFPRLYLETSHYIVDGVIEGFCERYGPDRLLFGTAYPNNPMGGALLRLAHAEIDEEAKSLIGAKNLERLLAEAQV